MKFCENCGTKLADNVLFCEECGAKQEVVEQSTQKVVTNETFEQPVAHDEKVENTLEEVAEAKYNIARQKLSETCSPASREIKPSVLILLLVMFSPYMMILLPFSIVKYINDYLWLGMQLIVLGLMWKKCNWSLKVKLMVIGIYLLPYLLIFFI